MKSPREGEVGQGGATACEQSLRGRLRGEVKKGKLPAVQVGGGGESMTAQREDLLCAMLCKEVKLPARSRSHCAGTCKRC